MVNEYEDDLDENIVTRLPIRSLGERHRQRFFTQAVPQGNDAAPGRFIHALFQVAVPARARFAGNKNRTNKRPHVVQTTHLLAFPLGI